MQKIDLNNKTILVTGGAGFIGSNLIKRLFKDTKGSTIINIDNLNDYYDVRLKEYRLKELETLNCQLSTVNYQFIKGDIADKQTIDGIFEEYKPQVVVNLAAQAGVRYSITNPDAYIQSNMIGFYNILEACRHSRDGIDNGQLTINYKGVEHLVYASSSSVYGGNKKVPFSTDDRVDNPVSLYAATKKSNELFAHCYSKLYDIPTTGLRFFTVYGPAGRPDMAYFGFTNKLLKGETIQIFNYGNCRRDFTYVDDIVEGVWRVMQASPRPSPEGKGEASPKSSPEGKDLGIHEGKGEASPKSSPEGKDLGIHTADPMMYGLLKERAEEMRKNPTEAESVLWDALRGNGLGVKFRQQHIIEDFIVDFYCNEYKVTVEVDGGYHKTPEQTASDAERTARLNELGYTELRFTNEEILGDLDRVLKTIKTFCSGTPLLQEGSGEAATPSPSGEGLGEAPYAIYNIGGGQPENLLDFVNILQEELVRAGVLPADFDFEAHKKLVPMQPGDVPVTYADSSALQSDFGFTPKITLREGLRKFATWYKEYYG